VWDIYLGIGLGLSVSAALFAAGLRLSRSCGAGLRALTGLAAAASLAAFVVFLHGKLVLARLIPFSNAIVLANWLAYGGALLSGLAWGVREQPLWRRALAGSALLLVALHALFSHLWGEPPPARNRWASGDVCIQSSPSTCAPACAATLLRYHGIPATEGEMSALCLTRRDGTTALGLYRGLKIKTRGTRWKVEVFRTDIEGLRSERAWPAILVVGLPRRRNVDPVYARGRGWKPGRVHSVVAYGFSGDGVVQVADPSVGREVWRVADLATLWRGEGLRLVER